MVSRHAAGVALVDQLGYRDLCKVGIAKELGAIEEGSAKGFRGQVNRIRPNGCRPSRDRSLQEY